MHLVCGILTMVNSKVDSKIITLKYQVKPLDIAPILNDPLGKQYLENLHEQSTTFPDPGDEVAHTVCYNFYRQSG